MHPASGEYCSPPLGGLIILSEYYFITSIGFGDNSLPKYLNLSEWLPHRKRYSPFSILTKGVWRAAAGDKARAFPRPATGLSHHYLFRRSDIGQRSPEKRRIAPQLGRNLGMSRSQIVQWIKEGKIKPVSGPGIDKSGHYLFTIQEQNNMAS